MICRSFVERNIDDLRRYVSCGRFVERNIVDVKMLQELWEFCGEKYW
jgi:hypothetical protein